MKFNLRYYQFLFCRAPIDQVVKAMCLFLKKETILWGKLQSGKYSQKLIDSTCYNNAHYYHAPKIRMLFFVPSKVSDITTGIITGSCTWDTWLVSGDPTLKPLSLRFTTNDKDDGAIRELAFHPRFTEYEHRRFIRVMKDPNWKLYVEGEPQSFEEGKSFEKIKGKRIKDYFTLEDLFRFVNNWGCPFDKEAFWASDQPMYVFGQLDDDDNPADWQPCSWKY